MFLKMIYSKYNNKIMKNFYTKLFLALGLLVPAITYANSPFLKPIKDLLGDLEIFIQFLNWALPALGVLVFFVLIVFYVMSKTGLGGEKIKVVGGGKGVFWALIGLAVLFAVYGLIQLLGALVGVDTNRAKTITAPSLPQVGGIRGGGYYNQ